MDWKEALIDIKKAQENERLVIFVGAGVSMNSGLPSWSDLIKVMAREIEYKSNLYKKKESNETEESELEKCFSQDEFLRIPEYLYIDNMK